MPHSKRLISEWLVFYNVIECGNLSRAAKKLDISVSKISKSIAKLEFFLGATLLRRSPRGIEITEAGKFTYEKAKLIVSSFYSLMSEIENDDGSISGRIRLSAPSVLCENVAGGWVSDYIKLHEKVRINLFSRERSDFSVSSPEFDDLVLKSGIIDSPDLVHHRLTPMPLFMCASPDYLKKHGHIQTPYDLVNHSVMRLNHPSMDDLKLTQGSENVALPIEDNTRLLSNNITAIVNLTLKGEGICIAAPYWLIADHVRNKALEIVLPDWNIPPLDIYLVWRYREYQSPLLKSFRKHIQEKWEDLVKVTSQ